MKKKNKHKSHFLTIHTNLNPTEVRTYLEVVVQTIKNPAEDFVTNSMITELEVSLNLATHKIRGRQPTYLHIITREDIPN